MVITLMDAKRFYSTEGKVIERQLMSFNTHTKAFSNGWCPCTAIKLLPTGDLVARISNELVPTEIYDGIEIEIPADSRFGKSLARKIS